MIVADTKDWTWVLERRCGDCGFDSTAHDGSVVAAMVDENVAAWRKLLEAGAICGGRPDDQTWSTLEYACHVRDVYRRFHGRIALMLAEDDPLFANWDQDASAVDDGYETQDPSEVVAQLAVAADELATQLRRVEPGGWGRRGRRSDGAAFTVATIARYMIHDPIHHVWDVSRQHPVIEIADRYRVVAGQFTNRAQAVSPAAWENAAPCDGWVARDVVRHMVAWMPAFFLTNAGVAFSPGPSVDVDPVAAWCVVSDAIQAALDDPKVAARPLTAATGSYTIAAAVATFGVGDVLVHTWDLARATGLDETLDVDEVRRLVANLDDLDRLLRPSPHFGARLDVADGADDQTRLLAFTGRRP